MRNAATALLVCLSFALASFASVAHAQEHDWLFVDRDLKWEAGPPDLGYQIAVGTLTVVRSSGKVLQLSCQFYRDSESAPIAFDLKSGYTVNAGRWSLDAQKMKVELRLIGAEKVGVAIDKPQAIPGPERTEVWEIVGGKSPADAGELTTAKGQQRRLQSVKNRNELSQLVKRYLNLTPAH